LATPVAAAWMRTGWVLKPSSTREVLTALSAIGGHSVGQRFAWRGLASTQFDLSSSLHRKMGPRVQEAEVREAEKRLIDQARTWGLGLGTTTYVDDLKLLADLQHYGIATRLIDFSRNPLTALWFACQTPKASTREKSGLVHALNVTHFPRFTTVRTEETWQDVGYGPAANLERALASGEPFLVDVAHPNDRLRAQEGVFIASSTPATGGLTRFASEPFGTTSISFSEGDPEALEAALLEERKQGAPMKVPFVAVVVPSGSKQKLLQYLEVSFNRTARTLFPDFAGFREFAAHGGEGGEVEDVPGHSGGGRLS
jgi:hypothetical protein